VKSAVKAGLAGMNHNRAQAKPGLSVKSAVKAGSLTANHNRAALV
jgi:hypothetical protein